MFYIILKSIACLAAFMLFYKLCLEQLSQHNFKRFYLLTAIIASIAIPFITFYDYIEPVVVSIPETISTTINTNTIVFNEAEIQEPTNYTSIILWSLYGLGVLIFGVKFILNLSRLFKQINTNETLKREAYTSVLLAQKVIPHTFFNYIFFNKTDYTTHQIPKEVVLHEQTHAKQKHSIDILCLELLQIVFWFNPLLYFIKKDIKLNHEFLADASVLKYGVTTKAYQYTLLDYTTNTQHNSLANAINYPTLKKRFKIMKTQSSQKALWLRSLLIAPLLALLVFSFSETEVIEKEVINNDNIQEQTKLNEKEDFILYVSKSPLQFKLNGNITSLETLKDDLDKLDFKNKSSLLILKADHDITTSLFKEIELSLENNSPKALWYKGVFADSGSMNSEVNSAIKTDLNKPLRELKKYETVIYIEQNPLKFKLNNKPTTLETLKRDFEALNFKSPVSVALETNEESIPMSLINKLKQVLGDNVKSFSLIKAYIDGDSKAKQKTPLTINGEPCSNTYRYNFTRKQFENLELGTPNGTITNFNIKFPKRPTVRIEGSRLNAKARQYLASYDSKSIISVFDIKSNNKDDKFNPVLFNLIPNNSEQKPIYPKIKKGRTSSIPIPGKGKKFQFKLQNYQKSKII